MLASNMKTVLATTYALSLKAQQFHWNVMGPDFPQYHEFFSNVYEEIYGAVDQIAETIRTLGELSPGSLQEFLNDTLITDEASVKLEPFVMMQHLAEDNETMIQVLNTAYESAEAEHQYDVSNFLAERLTAHKKHSWMLHSILGQQRQP